MYKFALYHTNVGHVVANDAPIGWESFKLKFLRDQQYHGMAIKFTLDLKWITQARRFISDVYNQLGIQAEITCVLYELDVNTKKWNLAYTGRLNLSKFVSSELSFECNIEQKGFEMLLLNQEDIEIDLYATKTLRGAQLPQVPPNQVLELHSKAISQTLEAKTQDAQAEYQIITPERTGTMYVEFPDMEKNEFDAFQYATGISFNQENLELIPFTADSEITVSFELDCEIKINAERGDFDYAQAKWFIGVNELEEIYTKTNSGVLETFHERMYAKGSRVYNVKAGDKLYFRGFVDVKEVSGPFLGGDAQIRYQLIPSPGMFITVTGTTTTSPSTANGMMVYEALDRMINIITGRPNSFYSELFGRTDSAPRSYAADGKASLTWMTNGFQLRKFPLDERTVSTNFKEAYSSLDAIWNIGMGTEYQAFPGGLSRQVVRIEEKAHFYQDIAILELGRVSNLTKEPASAYYYNEAEFGYSKWQNNQQGTLDEPNTKATRTLPMEVVKAKYSAISKYIASGYTIESTRRQTYEKGVSKDSSNDKEIFLVRLLRGAGSFVTLRNQNIEILNTLSPETMYNIDITPTRNLFRHGNVLNAGLLYEQDRLMQLQPGDGNFKVSTQLPGETSPIVEDMDIRPRDLQKPLWVPEFYNFDFPLRLSERKLIEANPYGFVVFKDKFGNKKKGYIVEVETNPFTKVTSWKLLRKYEE